MIINKKQDIKIKAKWAGILKENMEVYKTLNNIKIVKA